MAFDAYLKIDGVDGTATRKGFEKQMEILSFSFGRLESLHDRDWWRRRRWRQGVGELVQRDEEERPRPAPSCSPTAARASTSRRPS